MRTFGSRAWFCCILLICGLIVVRIHWSCRPLKSSGFEEEQQEWPKWFGLRLVTYVYFDAEYFAALGLIIDEMSDNQAVDPAERPMAATDDNPASGVRPNGTRDNESIIGPTSDPDGDRLKALLRKKRILKTHLTKARLALTYMLCNNEELEKIKCGVEQLLASQEEVIEILLVLCDIDADKYETELEAIQSDPVVSEVLKKSTDLLINTCGQISDNANPSTTSLGHGRSHTPISVSSDSPPSSDSLQVDRDMYQQLKKVTIPKFNGNKKDYPLFKDAFTQCVDQAKCSDNYKMLQLRQYLEGVALKAIENFPISSLGYQAAKNRLEDKFGGERRRTIHYLETIKRMKPIDFRDLGAIENFCDDLELSILALKEAGRSEEFDKDSMFYCVVKSKLPPSTIAHYKRHVVSVGETENLNTLFKWLSMEHRYRVEAKEEVEGLCFRNDKNVSLNQNKHWQKSSQSRAYATLKDSSRPTGNEYNQNACLLCTKHHDLQDCQLFIALPVNCRWDFARNRKLCFRCLRDSHLGAKCEDTQQCHVNNCLKTHHTLLHGEGLDSFQNFESSNVSQNPGPYNRYPVKQFKHDKSNFGPRARTHTANNGGCVAMRVVPVIVANGDRQQIEHALLDECSTESYADSELALELGLTGPQTTMDVGVLGGKLTTITSCEVPLDIRSLDGKSSFKFMAHTVDNVTGSMTVIDWNKLSKNWPHLDGIKFPQVGHNPRVRLLIGLSAPEIHRCLTEIYGRPGEPVARLTPLGWTVIGKYDTLENGVNSANHLARAFFIQEHEDTNKLIKQMWELESMGVSSSLNSPLNDKVDTVTKATIMYHSDRNRYSIGIPWRENEPKLVNNYDMAKSRLFNLEKSLLKRPEIGTAYCKAISDHLSKSYIREILPQERRSENIWYLPHFPIVRLDKTTTKVRPVMDAAARQNQKSLNDCIYQGPKLQRELFDILIRFRNGAIAVASDIMEMFLQVELCPFDSRFHRFLWRNMDFSSPIREFEYTRLVFGNTASPYLSQAVIREHAQNHAEKYPAGADSVINSMYVDDLLDSVNSLESAIKVRREITELLKTAGFQIRKWLSNDARVLSDIPESDRLSELSFQDGGLPSIKTLGILWHAHSDSFQFKIEAPPPTVLTKRFVVSKTASLFDPLNFLAPYTIRAKIGIQSSWLRGVDWDDELPRDLVDSWDNWFRELPELKDIKIQRCLVDTSNFQHISTLKQSLHTFVDASEKAYAAACYLRSEDSDKSVSVNLIAAKTRVAPLKAISIPRLELCGAILGLRLTQTIKHVLKINSVQYWSDSKNVLYWIHGESRNFKPFISHRVGEIHDLSNPEEWRYVPSKLNSSDLATRGLSVSELSDSKLWWHGPAFLGSDPDLWPVDQTITPDNALDELRNSNSSTFLVQLTDLGRLDPIRYSRWLKLIRVASWVFRFIWNLRNKEKCRESHLTSEEIVKSENFWFSRAQSEVFSLEICELRKNKSVGVNSKLSKLNPFLDSENVLRVGGRLEKASQLSYSARFPIVLPAKHPVSQLVLNYYHECAKHDSRVSLILSELRTKFWILRAREGIKGVIQKCPECNRRRRRPANQIMAPLPKMRLGEPLRAFARVGLDYAGPFLTKQGRGKIQTKRYLCLFTCLSTRAVHLEMAWGMDTDSFLLALDRFISRRSKPVEIVSDNGGNFVCAEREIKELLSKIDQSKIGDSLANKGIAWKFNPPLGPHFGGVFESMIKSAKRAIRATLGSADITDEELLTAITGAEGLLNSRPLTYIGDSASDDPF